jgi:ABC-type antimicrobial peptide transport system permease subunit
MPDMTLVVRSEADASRVASEIGAQIRALDPDVPLFDVQTMEGYVEQATAPSRFVLTTLALFSVAALPLASLGLYGVLSYLVGLRRSEIGLRMAFGADRRSIFGLVVGQAILLVSGGIVLGLLLSLLTTGFLRAFLFGVTPRIPQPTRCLLFCWRESLSRPRPSPPRERHGSIRSRASGDEGVAPRDQPGTRHLPALRRQGPTTASWPAAASRS